MKIFKPTFKKYISFLLIITLVSIMMIPASANTQNYNEIRVLLKNGKYDNEHYVTLSNPQGMVVTTNSGYSYESTPNENLSIQIDRFHLELIETTDLAQAKDLVAKVASLKDYKLNSNIEIIEKGGQNYYRVIVGGFDSYDTASKIQVMLKEKLNINANILGFYYLSAGEFASIDEANIKLKELRDNGFNGYIVKSYNGTQWVNQVWVGQAVSAAQLQKVKEAIVAKLPNISLTDANYTGHYAIEKQNGTIVNGQIVTNKLLVFSKASIVSVNSIDNSAILIKERSYQGKSNKYRGEIIIQTNNYDMLVINKLPLESYLYAVVGSEVSPYWHTEALKAQTVAARTFAYAKLLNPRSSLFNIYDTVEDQAYYGTYEEAPSIIEAVDATKGTVILQNGKPITSFYSSNSGGITSDGTEVWGNPIPYTSVKSSPWDAKVLENTMNWYRIIRANGQTGYVRSDFVDKQTKTNGIGLNYGVINTDNVNLRTGPSTVRFPNAITTLPKAEEIVILDTVYENNAYSWIAGPFTAEDIMNKANKYQLEGQPQFTQPILDLQVANRGPSGRVTLLADGNKPIPVKYPDYYRTFFGSLTTGVQSTLFDIEQTGRIEVLGANGSKRSIVAQKDQTYVISANSVTTLSSLNYSQEEYIIATGNNSIRVASKDQKYILQGNGLGHGTGMSQYGIKGMAEDGYNYQEILKYYYNGIELKTIY